jgi:NUMOD3 motif
MNNIFYVYLIRDPSNFEPIYFGKGQGDRMLKHWKNILCGKPYNSVKLYNRLTSIFRSGYQAPIYEKLLECEDEKACFLLERFMINTIGRETLCNLTDGGEGPSGWIHSEEIRERLRISHLGQSRPLTEVTRKKMSDAKKGKPLHENTRLAAIRSHTGSTMHPNTRSALLKSLMGRTLSDATRKKLIDARAARIIGPEFSKKMRDSWVVRKLNGKAGVPHTAESRQRMRDSWIIRKAKVLCG